MGVNQVDWYCFIECYVKYQEKILRGKKPGMYIGPLYRSMAEVTVACIAVCHVSVVSANLTSQDGRARQYPILGKERKRKGKEKKQKEASVTPHTQPYQPIHLITAF
jgi:hypothetical protein